MGYLTIAPLVLVKVPDEVGDGFRVDYHYAGSVIPKLYGEQATRFLDEGFVAKIGDVVVGPTGTALVGDVTIVSGDPVDEKPLHAASKAAWVDFAISRGANADEAEASTKAELIELYG